MKKDVRDKNKIHFHLVHSLTGGINPAIYNACNIKSAIKYS